MKHYYVETDGRVFLVKKGRRKSFPTSTREIPFKFKQLRVMNFDSSQVVFCRPNIGGHPHHWQLMDELLADPKVDSLVKEAVFHSVNLATSHVVLEDRGKVLLAMGKRGWNVGKWGLPGGVIGYGENSVKSVKREALEEVNLKVKVTDFLGEVNPKGTWYGSRHFMVLIYRGAVSGGKLRANQDDVSEARWFGVDEALKLRNLKSYVRQALKLYNKWKKTRRPALE